VSRSLLVTRAQKTTESLNDKKISIHDHQKSVWTPSPVLDKQDGSSLYLDHSFPAVTKIEASALCCKVPAKEI
jgi:hypothetical protein